MKRITTESGAVYLLGGNRIKRVSSANEMREDGRWLRLLSDLHPVIGQRMQQELEPLAPGATVTWRTSTPVVSIEEVQ